MERNYVGNAPLARHHPSDAAQAVARVQMDQIERRLLLQRTHHGEGKGTPPLLVEDLPCARLQPNEGIKGGKSANMEAPEVLFQAVRGGDGAEHFGRMALGNKPPGRFEYHGLRAAPVVTDDSFRKLYRPHPLSS